MSNRQIIFDNTLSFAVPLQASDLFTRTVWGLNVKDVVNELLIQKGQVRTVLPPVVSLRLNTGCKTDQRVRTEALSLTLFRQPCYLGGSRWWLGCPACGRKVYALYRGKDRVACRHCLQLQYASRVLSDAPRLMHHYSRLREQLEHRPGPKPRRYWKYLTKEDHFTRRVIQGLVNFGQGGNRQRRQNRL